MLVGSLDWRKGGRENKTTIRTNDFFYLCASVSILDFWGQVVTAPMYGLLVWTTYLLIQSRSSVSMRKVIVWFRRNDKVGPFRV